MVEQMKKSWFIFALLLVLLSTGCGSKNMKAQTLSNNSGSDNVTVKLIYYAPTRYWRNNGTELVVSGNFFNLSSEYDIVELNNAYINLNDIDGNTITSVRVNERMVGCIPHNGNYPYNFTVNSIPGGSSSYRPSSLIPTLETEFTYTEHLTANCPNCAGSASGKAYNSAYPIEPEETVEPVRKACWMCGGSGYRVCPDCNGTGKLDEMFQGVLRAMEHGRCVRCEGTGKIICTSCLGEGY